MEVSRIIAEIDAQILKLQQARVLLSDTTTTAVAEPVVHARRGRPKGSKNSATKTVSKAASKTVAKTTASAPVRAKRKLSPEGRKRIAEAMKKRWAERKKQAAK